MRDVRQEGLTRRYLVAILVAVLVVAADQITKRLALTAFADEELTVIPGVLWFTYTENPGAAFSLFQDGGRLLAVAAMVAVVFVLFVLRTPRLAVEVVAFGMILGGAVGNLIDRIVRADSFLDGKVIDWIRFPSFPVFNLADSSVTVAVALLLIASWRHPDERPVEA